MFINATPSIHLMNRLHKKKIPILPKMIYFFNRVVFSCDVRPNQYLHSTVEFPHNALGVVIHVNSQIHENVKILHQVTLGGVGGKFGQYNNKKIDALCVKFM